MYLDSIIHVQPSGRAYHERGEVNLLLLGLDSSILDFKRSIRFNYKVSRSNKIISDIFQLKGMPDSSMFYKLK
ncbi:hypothetical protein BDE36_4381 [Arcticibacter tournemirensis]|nr:hypothetical protein BDE36_4381 [Arcticibacter tournemirensis]